MFARVKNLDPVDLYVTAVILVVGLCTVALFLVDAGELPLVFTPEVALFALFALVGDFLPLKVFTRGAEGEVTTPTCFAVAAMLTAGPLAALLALVCTNLIADGLRRKPLKKILFNVGQYAITVAASGAVLQLVTGLPRATEPHLLPSDMAGVLLAAVVFFVFNTAFVSTVIALVSRASVF